jgi:hypothetical protein
MVIFFLRKSIVIMLLCMVIMLHQEGTEFKKRTDAFRNQSVSTEDKVEVFSSLI